MNDETALEVMTTQDDLPAIADDTLVAVAEAAEKRIDAMVKIKRLALKMTGPQDWTDQGGKPFPWASGAEKIARLFGISWKVSEPIMEHEEGGHFSYTYKGTFTLAGTPIEAIGVRSSKDGFFKKYKEGTELPVSAIDKGDVKKSAYTNLLGNGIMRILGMRNLSWADLEAAGIRQGDVSKVAFKKNGKTDAGIASEGSTTIETFITDIKMQTKKKDGSLMKSPLYKINAEGKEYKTFSETLAKTAKEAKDAARKVVITFVTNKYGNDAENIIFADEGPGVETEREPGQEG
ncbi:MAG: hypothetical protein PHC68_08175 [Syntrophorhabdaceae bacterium]|nr:hypothetical protein [Syntrophorhabdaceae bacterium]